MLCEQTGSLLHVLTLRWRKVLPAPLTPLRRAASLARSSAAKKSVVARKNSSKAWWLQTIGPSSDVEKPQWPPWAVKSRKKCGLLSKSSKGSVAWSSPRMGSSWLHTHSTGMATSSMSLRGSFRSQYASQLPAPSASAPFEPEWQNRASSIAFKEQLENKLSVWTSSPSTVLYLQFNHNREEQQRKSFVIIIDSSRQTYLDRSQKSIALDTHRQSLLWQQHCILIWITLSGFILEIP